LIGPDQRLADASVVHQRIDPAELDQGRAGDVRERVRLCQIGGHRVDAASEVGRALRQFRQRRGVAIHCGDVVSGGQQRDGHGETHTAGGTGDDNGLVVRSH
jgi:hypothetical protein